MAFTYAHELPTVDECREFLALINKGREALGLERLEKIPVDVYDGCDPNNGDYCLSATTLFGKAGFFVAYETLDVKYGNRRPHRRPQENALIEALDLKWPSYSDGYIIPAAIKRVTDPFDERLNGLRERLIEAEVIG